MYQSYYILLSYKGNISYDLHFVNSLTNSLTKINTDLTATKKSVSDGKSSIASAITAKGVTTIADDTFVSMARNINAIITLKKPDYVALGHKVSGSGGEVKIPISNKYISAKRAWTNWGWSYLVVVNQPIKKLVIYQSILMGFSIAEYDNISSGSYGVCRDSDNDMGFVMVWV